MKQRLISAMFMLPLLILLVVGGIPLYIGGLVLMVIALHEFYTAFRVIKFNPLNWLGYLCAVLMFIGNFRHWKPEYYAFSLFMIFIVAAIVLLTNKINVLDVSITFSGMLYVCFCFNYIILTVNQIEKGYIYVWLIFIIAFATDIFAYFIGKKFGRRKLIPLVSPKKTVEGSVGGIIASVVFSTLFAIGFSLPVFPVMMMGLVGSFVAQVGDLTASSIKRYVGIKDFGRIIPGHGGVLDRFDSVILVAPFVYLSLKFLLNL